MNLAGQGKGVALHPPQNLDFFFLFFSESIPSLGCLYADTSLNPSMTSLKPPMSYSA